VEEGGAVIVNSLKPNQKKIQNKLFIEVEEGGAVIVNQMMEQINKQFDSCGYRTKQQLAMIARTENLLFAKNTSIKQYVSRD